MIGLQYLSSSAYHADECGDEPTLSKSIAHILLTHSPAHAYTAHPRLNPWFERKDEDRFDVGTCAHALLLEGEAGVVVVDAPDWRTGAAKDAREAARKAGRIPLLAKHSDAVEDMITAVHRQLDERDDQPPLFTAGQPEQTIVWDEQGVKCRARLDWLRDDLQACDDFKTTSASAHPAKWGRTAYGIGADLQVAMYLRGIRAVFGAEPVFRFLVVETYPPYALSVVTLSAAARAFADEKLDVALATWKQCLASGEWPAYPAGVGVLDAPAWEQVAWLERQEVEA